MMQQPDLAASFGPDRVDGDAALQLDDPAAPSGRTAVALCEDQPLACPGGFADLPGTGCGESVGILKSSASRLEMRTNPPEEELPPSPVRYGYEE
jgi:hypothetical protein